MSEIAFYHQGNNKKAVILIHGLTGAPAEMKYVGKALHAEGFTVSAPLLAGHGRDIAALMATRWQDWYSSVEEAYKKLKADGYEVYAAGICVGGALALQLAYKNPDIAGVTVYSTTMNYDGWSMPQWYKMAPFISIFASLPFIRNIQIAEKTPFGLKDERLRRMVASGRVFIEGALDFFPVGALKEMYSLNKHIKKILPQIKAPVLLLHAREDDMSSARNPLYVQKHIGGPCALEWLEDSYHMIHVDQERKLVAARTASFFGAKMAEGHANAA